MNKTLLPCPFCGGKAKWMYRKPIGWVICKKCGASSAAFSDYYEEADCLQKAIAAWNSRKENTLFKLDTTRQIAVVWDIKDVQGIRKDLTDAQALEVLLEAVRHHDASIGINWDVLETIADDLYPKN